MKKLIQFLFIIFLACSNIVVYLPQELKDKFAQLHPKGLIPSSYANFGRIPYGSNLAGRVFYFPNNSQACKAFPFVKLSPKGDPDGDVTPIILVEKGGCSFVKKARNVQEFGGTLTLIINDDSLDNPEKVLLADDGTGESIFIPTLLISKEDGTIIKEFLTNPSIDDEYKSLTSLIVNFFINNPDNRVEYDIWYLPNQKKSINFISEFHGFNSILGKKVLMTPRIVLSSCLDCTSKEKEQDCVCNMKYCILNNAQSMFTNSSIHGREIILEGLRQKCIYNLTFKNNQGEQWWEYIDYIKDFCNYTISETCYKQAINYIGLKPSLVDKCIESSYIDDKKDNIILKEDLLLKQNFNGNIYPQIVINNMSFRGNLESSNVFSAICAGFNETPSNCFSYDSYEGITSNTSKIFFLIIVIVILIISINAIGLLLYRKYTKQELREEMQLEITSMMSQYIALSKEAKRQIIV